MKTIVVLTATLLLTGCGTQAFYVHPDGRRAACVRASAWPRQDDLNAYRLCKERLEHWGYEREN